MIQIPLRARGGSIIAYALIDDDDYKWAQYRWCLSSEGYAKRALPRLPAEKSQRTQKLHRAILGLEHGDPRQADHWNGNRLDCRKENLRIVSAAENSQNQFQTEQSSSRYRGVYLKRGDRRRSKRWVAQVRHNGRVIHLGYHETEIAAALAAQACRQKIFTHSNEHRQNMLAAAELPAVER